MHADSNLQLVSQCNFNSKTMFPLCTGIMQLSSDSVLKANVIHVFSTKVLFSWQDFPWYDLLTELLNST